MNVNQFPQWIQRKILSFPHLNNRFSCFQRTQLVFAQGKQNCGQRMEWMRFQIGILWQMLFFLNIT